MKIDTQRTLDKLLGIPLCWLLSLFDWLRPRRKVEPPRAILVVLLSEAGSMVCAQPMLRALKSSYPRATLHVMVLERNRDFVEILGLIAPERILTVSDRSLGTFAVDSLRAIRRMHAARVDTVIDCELFSRVSAIYSYLSGANLRVGFHRHTQEGLYRGTFINRPVLYNPYSHIAAQFLALAAAIESDSTPAGKQQSFPERPAIVPISFDARAVSTASEQLYRNFPALRKRPLVLIYAGAGPLPIRAWPVSHFQALASALIRDGYVIGVVGLESDRPLNQTIVEHCASPLCVNLAGYTATIRDLVLLFHSAALLVSNDGGPVHFAALTSMPVLALFGPETPVLYGPLSPQARCLFRRLPCSPCLSAYNHRRTPCDGDNQCLKQISVAEALEAARQLMGEVKAVSARDSLRCLPPACVHEPDVVGVRSAP
jgi:lipopolysaccharide heptosyltransferase II